MISSIPLATGRGLDRSTGLAAVSPEYPVDARNIYARDEKASIRPGLSGTPWPALPWGTDLIATVPIKATGDQLFCVYDRTSRQLRIFRLDPVAFLMQPLNSPANGIWGTLSSVTPFPVVTAAEANGLVFFAHDEATMAFRLATIYYSPNFTAPDVVGTLTTLTADLDGDGVQAPVYFRGVYAYLAYMNGWGFGTEAEDADDRGDILRQSKPGEPTEFLGGNYVIAGAQKDPILNCVATEDILAIGKENESYRLTGTSALDFKCDLLDGKYGVVSSRCATNVGGIAYWWAKDGARRVLRGGTEPIAQPLELISPLPDDFPTRGPARECFVVFDRDRYLLEWLFPNIVPVQVRTPSFILSLWNPADPRWTFGIREQCLTCAGEMFVSDTLELPPPDGYASDVTAEDSTIAPDARYRRVAISWLNNSAAGDERVQIFAKPAGGAWSLFASVGVGDAEQSANVDIFLPLREYEIALRYVRGAEPGPGYEGEDPDDWTAPTAAGAMATFETSSAPVAWAGSSFVPPSGPLTLQWASAQVGATYMLEKDTGGGFELVAEDIEDFSYVYTVPAEELETTVTFKVTAKRGTITGPNTGNLDRFMGFVVGGTNWISAVWDPEVNPYVPLVWSPASEATEYLLEKTTNGGGSWSSVATVAATTYNYTPAGAEVNQTVGFRLTPKNGVYSGPVSLTQNVTFTVVAPVMVSCVWAGNIMTATWDDPVPLPTSHYWRFIRTGGSGPGGTAFFNTNSPDAQNLGTPKPAGWTGIALYVAVYGDGGPGTFELTSNSVAVT